MRLAPEYEAAATELTLEDQPIPLGKVDCPANSDLCGRFGVTGYTTLKIFRGGEFSADYAGPRTSDGIVSYMKKQGGPSSREFKDVDGLKDFLKHSEHSIVGFFTDSSGKLAKTFKTLADGLRESFRFAHSTSETVLAEFGYTDHVVIFQPPQLHTKLEENVVVYDGAAKLADLKSFVKTRFMGLAGVRNQDNRQFFDAQSPLAVVYYDVDYEHNPKGSNYWRNRVIKVAKDFVGEVSFAVSSKAVMGGELQQFGIGPDQEVGVGVFDSQGRKYAMTEKFSVDSLREFITQFLAGEVEPYIKSEPLPDNSGPVTVSHTHQLWVV
jgi:protein disulfide isomerase family A protein 3